MPPPPTSSTYFHNALATIVCHPAGYLRIDWKAGPVASADVRALFRQVLAVLKHEQLRKVLADCTNAPPLPPDDWQWLEREWLPRAVQEAGVMYYALVQSPREVPPRVPYVSVDRRNALPLVIRPFSSAVAAAAWLQEAT